LSAPDFFDDLPTIYRVRRKHKILMVAGACLLGAVFWTFVSFEWRLFLLELDAREVHTHTRRIRHLEERGSYLERGIEVGP
jgi:hypothetical protein